MPNQLNYPEKIRNSDFQRPSRLKDIDLSLIESGSSQILYGTRTKDNVEVWAYHPDGTYAGHALLRPIDPELSLSTVIDTSGATELLNIDLRSVSLKMNLSPGRYAVVMNFFRDEVGAEDGYKMVISDISKDRTEIKLTPINVTEEVIRDIYEFIVPSVPRRYAQALIDQTFGESLDALPNEQITPAAAMSFLNSMQSNTEARVRYTDAYNSFALMVERVRERTRDAIIDSLVADAFNYAVQKEDLMRYVRNSLEYVIYNMKLAGEIDPRFNVS